MSAHRRTLAWLTGVLLVTATPNSLAAPLIGPAQGRPAAGWDTVVIGALREPDTLNPLFEDTLVARSVISTIFTKDVQIDDNWRFRPQGVEYLPVVEDGTWTFAGDRMTLLWKLRHRNWHDGRPVTCGDYVFTLAVARDPRVPTETVDRFYMSRIAGISCPKGAGGAEMVVTWKQRDAFANAFPMATGGVVLLPRHLLEPYYRANPGQLDRTPYGVEPAGTIGDGAYRLVEWQKGASLTVEAIANHPIFGTPKVGRIVWRFYASSEAMSSALLAGQIDVVHSVPAIPFETALRLDRQAAGRFRVIFERGGFIEYMAFNLDNPFLQDVRVRQAIAYGINRKQIVQQLYAGKQPVAHSYLPAKHPGFTEDVKRYPYDPSRAKALLRDAGFVSGPDGVVRNAIGQRLVLEHSTTAGNRDREHAQVIIQEQLRQIGVEIKIVNFPARLLLGEILVKRRFGALIVYATPLGPGATCEGLLTSNSIPTASNGWRGGNWMGYRNAKMDQICAEADSQPNEARRNELLRESARIASHDLPVLPMYYRVTIAAVKSGLRNFSIQGLPNDTETWNAHQWAWE